VVLLARRLLERLGAETGCPGVRLSEDAERVLESHRWPGNVRELRNRLERALLLSNRQELHGADLGEFVAPAPTGRAPTKARTSLRQAERLHLEAVLREESGDVRRAAAVLGVSRSALYQRIKKHGIPLSEPIT
jgi:DNA-binding NtrC family response regulator